ncbi:sigma factor-like helix-turn-helix DNA-binding protein [Tengunoibacter tsumagoiensis]|uniref:RNA polymerase sigma-70 region 4 domain-containing protein n=1 Tax=Tengunoibacter tsumagoiensis TaxID=2014871 RepID=A0A401ZWA9_9CHLR|nr:sigma factor-like helix-turn-helix DNA-binding protein [Tengunoibacter tsumagoiensis]GCE11189.1 hypothetical protein KTT_10480 [Tengunoibacter tsumagoiensis]
MDIELSRLAYDYLQNFPVDDEVREEALQQTVEYCVDRFPTLPRDEITMMVVRAWNWHVDRHNAQKDVDLSRRALLRKLLSHLTQRERQVIELRYGLVSNQIQTLEEISKVLNVSREYVRMIEERALRKLKPFLDE